MASSLSLLLLALRALGVEILTRWQHMSQERSVVVIDRDGSLPHFEGLQTVQLSHVRTGRVGSGPRPRSSRV